MSIQQFQDIKQVIGEMEEVHRKLEVCTRKKAEIESELEKLNAEYEQHMSRLSSILHPRQEQNGKRAREEKEEESDSQLNDSSEYFPTESESEDEDDDGHYKCRWEITRKTKGKKTQRICGQKVPQKGEFCTAHRDDAGVVSSPQFSEKNGMKTLSSSVYEFMLKTATHVPHGYTYFLEAMFNSDDFLIETQEHHRSHFRQNLLATLFSHFRRRKIQSGKPGDLMAKRENTSVVFWRIPHSENGAPLEKLPLIPVGSN